MLNVISGIFSEGVPPIPPSTNSYESIATYTIGSGGSSSISFTSIPSTYKHLQLRGILRSTNADVTDMPRLTMNSDNTSSNYRGHGIQANGATVYYGDLSGDPYIRFGRIAAANNTSGIFAPFVLDLLDYQNTSKNKVIRSLCGNDTNSSDGWITTFSGIWLSTAAISTLTITTGANIAQYSQIGLYGIKG